METILKRLEVLFDLQKYDDMIALAYEHLYREEEMQGVLYAYIIAAHFNREACEEALKVCEEALGYYPNDPHYLYFKSKALLCLSRYDKALEVMGAVLRASPNDPEYLKHHAEILFWKGRYFWAKEEVEKALAHDAGDAAAHLLLARILYMIGGEHVGREIVDDVLAREPHNEEALAVKKEFFTSTLAGKMQFAKALLFLNPFDKESQRDLRFTQWYYRYIPWLMAIVTVGHALWIEGYGADLTWMHTVVVAVFFAVATVGANDWRFNMVFIGVNMLLSLYAENHTLTSAQIAGAVLFGVLVHFLFRVVSLYAEWLIIRLISWVKEKQNG